MKTRISKLSRYVTVVMLISAMAFIWAACSFGNQPSMAGNWQGTLTTEAINVKLIMSIQGSGDDHSGTWETLGAGDQLLTKGTLTGVLAGKVVMIVLISDSASPSTLTGQLMNNNKIVGIYTPSSPGGNGAFNVTKQ